MMPAAVVILGASALDVARRVQACLPGAQVHGLAGRVDADVAYTGLGAHLRDLYARGTPIVALCAAGIVIRCVAPLLANKGAEPPVLAVAEDGSAVVPLLGGLAGVNVLAREIAAALGIAPAITTSGELRFQTCVLNPPDGYVLADLAHGKRFVSDLLAGGTTRIEGDAPWLDEASLPRDDAAPRAIRVTPFDDATADDDALLIHPRSVVAAIASSDAPERDDGVSIEQQVRDALRAHRIARHALAALLAPAAHGADAALAEAARALDVPLRFIDCDSVHDVEPSNTAALHDEATNVADNDNERSRLAHHLLRAAVAVPHDVLPGPHRHIALAVATRPLDVSAIGRPRGRVTVLGLGPGRADLLVPAARDALADATDILGYATYVRMAGPFRDDQRVHATDNREELQRARHAFELAAQGQSVVVVSSGDPGVFAMAAAVLEALDASDDPRWAAVDLRIVPGISAAMATAAQAGAPLGHDFCILSLSDNLKPWSIVETRLRHAAQADLVMAFYNPVSRARPWQLDAALDIVRAYRTPGTRVVLGRDIGRPGGTLKTTTLGALNAADVDMRTTVIVGSSTTRGFARGDGDGEWVYTPRSYP